MFEMNLKSEFKIQKILFFLIGCNENTELITRKYVKKLLEYSTSQVKRPLLYEFLDFVVILHDFQNLPYKNNTQIIEFAL